MSKNTDMLYYIPEWDDLVTKNYDFENDKDIDKEKLYAHEIYPQANYDGILASRMKLEESKSKIVQMREMGGVHQFFRFSGPVFGDCGAWGYVKEKDPPFKTNDLLDFYHELRFDFGVSIDHLCIPGFEEEFYYRKALTLKNAEKFYSRHQQKGYSFIPVGVAQGWNEDTYRQSIHELLDIGYRYLALGGIARAPSQEIIKILQAIKPELEKVAKFEKVDLHLFGVARLEAIRPFRNLGVTSFDSASPLRTAWLSSKKNYRDMNWNGYAAIRLPFLARDRKFKELIANELYSVDELEEKELMLKIMLHRLDDDGSRTPEEVVEGFINLYNEFVPKTPDRTAEYMRTLEQKPWKNCQCPICKELGIEVIIFRGNNRNRRRGFHNTYVFYSLLKKMLIDENFTLEGELDEESEESERKEADEQPGKGPKKESKSILSFLKPETNFSSTNTKKGKDLLEFL